MLVREGEKLLVAHRRLYEGDPPRFFVGQVDAYDAGIVRATGYSYVRDAVTGRMIQKPEPRTRLLSLTAGTLLVYVLPETTDLERIEFIYSGNQLMVTDGGEFTMGLAEFLFGRRGLGAEEIGEEA
ncbi:MAG: hypothetical protein NZ700_09475 [Gemmataceae bacterium]|nr:hypothetical protein [Gemmataceae bacterium]MDW8264258.1 hypothetical protein [Gemmataceae bacterium]